VIDDDAMPSHVIELSLEPKERFKKATEASRDLILEASQELDGTIPEEAFWVAKQLIWIVEWVHTVRY